MKKTRIISGIVSLAVTLNYAISGYYASTVAYGQDDTDYIVYERYQYSNDNTVDYDYINYAPEETYPLLSRANGKFILNPELQYYGNCYSTWDEDKTLG